MSLGHRGMLYFFAGNLQHRGDSPDLLGRTALALTLVAAGCATDADPSVTSRAASEPAAAVLAAEEDHGHAAAHEEASEEDTASHTLQQQHDACRGPATPDSRDSQITTGDAAVILKTGSGQDTTLPPQVLDWMKETQFAEAHDGWHLVRRWDQGCRKSNAPAAGCAAAQRLLAQGLWRADAQQGAPGDGLNFLMAHRHMIIMLKETFPKHAGLFSSFKRIPKTKGDSENPQPWRNISWTSNNLRGFDILENIEKNVGMFASEDELGHFIQGSIRWTASSPSVLVNQPGSGLHGALHGQWSVIGSPIALINQAVDVRNFVFWKLHGWIDDVWERYRIAKGQKQSDADYQRVMYDQCMEMHALEPRNRKGVKPVIPNAPTGTDEGANGFFAKSVRPIFDGSCTGCHSALGGAAAGLVLGGAGLSTKEVLEGIVNVPSTNGEYALVVPGNPDKSWLFLKAAGTAERVTCKSECLRDRMPPAGATLSASQLATIRQWIQNGATIK